MSAPMLCCDIFVYRMGIYVDVQRGMWVYVGVSMLLKHTIVVCIHGHHVGLPISCRYQVIAVA